MCIKRRSKIFTRRKYNRTLQVESELKQNGIEGMPLNYSAEKDKLCIHA